MKYRRLVLVLAVCLALIAAACGSDDEPAPAAPAETTAPAETAAPAEEPEPTEPEPDSTEAADEVPCDFDDATCEYLAGKDFSGQTLTVGVWGGDIETLLRDVVIPPLEARGATVELLLGGAGDRLAKLYAEHPNPTMDVLYLNIHTGRLAVLDGVAEAASDEIPAYADLYPIAKDSEVYGVSLLALGIQYNTEAFDGPPEWADLWNEAHKGKIAFPTFPSTGGDGMIAIAARLEGGTEHDTDLAFEKIAQLKPVPLVYTSQDELGLLMDAGEVVAAANLSGYAVTAADNFDTVDFSFPKDPGPILAMDTMVISAGSPNRDLALAWAQIALSPKTQQAYAERIYFGPTNSKVELSPELAQKVVYGPEAVEALIALDWPYVAEARTTLTERWNREILED